ncbi:hypothetical protein F4778DRAFT_746448 [Xylariomycetidae sp. FL2044]|nr:hypothetical protein F4778DRAFT_746448 [Xylariomycetidae sp. FL2044]
MCTQSLTPTLNLQCSSKGKSISSTIEAFITVIMVSPIGVGDAIAIAKLSRFLYQAFVTGRRSAPSEFRRVEEQLHSLSVALFAVEALDDFRSEDRIGLRQQLSQVLVNCKSLLTHLEETIKEHTAIVDPPNPGQPRLRRWTKRCLSTWQRISWTVDRQGLSALVEQMSAHTNSLNLILLVANSSRIKHIRDNQEHESKLHHENKGMLREIYNYYVENLKNNDSRHNHQPLHVETVNERRVWFELHALNEQNNGLICPQVSLEVDLGAPDLDREPLFACNCRTPGSFTAHAHAVASLHLTDSSFAVRVAGDELSWQLLQLRDSNNGMLVSLLVKNMLSRCVLEFERNFVRPLASSFAASVLNHGTNNLLAYFPSNLEHGKVLSVVNDLDSMRDIIEDITITVGPTSYTQDAIDYISLLLYENHSKQSHPDDHLRLPDNYAEIVVYYEESPGSVDTEDIVRTDIRLTLASSVHLDVSDAHSAIHLENIKCAGVDKHGNLSHIEGATVSFHTTTADGARRLHDRINSTKKELLAHQIQYPRQDEETIYRLQSVAFQNDIVDITNGELLVTRDHDGRHRLIISSHDRCTVLSTELKPEFFRDTGRGSVFSAPADIIQLRNRGSRNIMRYGEGFRANNFRDANSSRMIELARKVIGGSLPIRTIEEN